MSGGTIYCAAQLAHGIMASGGGTLTVEGGTMNTSGKDSPGIYSTGVISVTGATLTATGSEGAVIEGKNTVTLTDTHLSGGQSNYGGVPERDCFRRSGISARRGRQRRGQTRRTRCGASSPVLRGNHNLLSGGREL